MNRSLIGQSLKTTACLVLLLVIAEGSYIATDNIYVGAFAFCSNTCTAA